MKIYRKNVLTHDLLIDDKTTIKRRLMVENSLNLSVVVPKDTPLNLAIGDYTDIGGERYIIMDEPQYSLRNGVYEYSVLMRGNLHRLEVYMMPDEGQDEWWYYNPVVEQISKVLAILNTKESGWSVVLPDLTTLSDVSSKNINYGNMSILSAFHAICSVENGWGLEFDVEGKRITFAKEIKRPTQLQFEYGRGKGLYELTRGQSSGEKIATRVYGYGGEANMPIGQRLDFSSVNDGKNYIDKNIDLYGLRETRVNFDHIYPRRNSAITSDAVQVAVGKANWTVKDSTLDFDLDAQTVEGSVIMFNTGDCVGEEFKIIHYDHATKTVTFAESVDENSVGTYVLPNADRYPKVGDEYIFVNILMPDSYILAAKNELKAAVIEHANKVAIPQRNYTVKCDPRYFKSLGLSPIVGDGVRLIDAAHGVDYVSRIIEINYPVIYPHNVDMVLSDKIPIPAGVVMSKSIKEIKTKMAMLDRGNLTEDHLRKIFHPLGGGLDVDLAAKDVTAKSVKSEKVVTNEIGSSNFAEGIVTSGFKIWLEDGKSIAQFNKLKVDELIVDLLTIQKVQAIGGVLILTPAYANITRVDSLGSTYKCYYKPDVSAQMWVVGDQALCKNRGKYYWRLVTSISDVANANGEFWLNLSTTTADGSGIPAEGDEIVLLGHRGAQADRTNALILSSGVLGYSNPFTYYQGITAFSLADKEMFVIGSKTKFKCHEFSIIAPDGTVARTARECGAWVSGKRYYYFDRVSRNGSMWLCVLDNGSTGTTVAPADGQETIWLCEVRKGQNGATGGNGDVGADGLTPVIYSLAPSATTIKKDKAGVISPEQVNCRVQLKVGNEQEVIGVDAPIEFAGRNLFRDTKGFANSAIWNATTSGGIVKWGMVGDFQAVKIMGQWGRVWQEVSYKKNQPYTFSCWIRKDSSIETALTYFNIWLATSDITINVATLNDVVLGRNVGSIAYTYLTDEFQKLVVCFTPKIDLINSNDFRIEFASDNPSTTKPGGVIYGYKLEKGNRATDWSAAPEDYAIQRNGEAYTAGAIKNPTDTINWTLHDPAKPTNAEPIDRSSTTLVEDGKDAPVLKTQFSVNGTSNWHTTYADGDKYRRESNDNGATWSGAMLMYKEGKDGAVGADGKKTPYTDFSYGYGLAQPTQWSDAPPTKVEGQHLWERIQKYTVKVDNSGWTLASTSYAIINEHIEIGGRNLLLDTLNPSAKFWTWESQWSIWAQIVTLNPSKQCTISGNFNEANRVNVYSGDTFIGSVGSPLPAPYTFTGATRAEFIFVSLDEIFPRKPKIEIGNKATDWSPAPEDIQIQIDASNAKIADMANDDKLVPSEKQQTAIEWNRIQKEHTANHTAAAALGVSTGDLVSAYNTLNSLMGTVLANLTTTSDINGVQFRTAFAQWYDKNAAITVAIGNAQSGNAKITLIDATTLDQNTYYPVTMGLSPINVANIRIGAELHNSGYPAWATHGGGFSMLCEWTNNGNGWGTIPSGRRINKSTWAHAQKTPFGDVGQMNNSDNEYIYIRGGGRYTFTTTNVDGITLRTSAFTSNYQTISPKTSVFQPRETDNEILDNAAADATAKMEAGRQDLAKGLGYANYEAMAAKYSQGETMIKGRYINTGLINAEALVAQTAFINALTSNAAFIRDLKVRKLSTENAGDATVELEGDVLSIIKNNTSIVKLLGGNIDTLSQLLSGNDSGNKLVPAASVAVVESQWTHTFGTTAQAAVVKYDNTTLDINIPLHLQVEVEGEDTRGVARATFYLTNGTRDILMDIRAVSSSRGASYDNQAIVGRINVSAGSWRVKVVTQLTVDSPEGYLPMLSAYLSVGNGSLSWSVVAANNRSQLGRGLAVIFDAVNYLYYGNNPTNNRKELIYKGHCDLPNTALVGYDVTVGGGITHRFGAKARPSGNATYLGNGKYQIPHDIGHREYNAIPVVAGADDNSTNIAREISTQRTNTHCVIRITDLQNNGVQSPFTVTIFGKN